MGKYKHIILRVLTILFWTSAGAGFTVLFASALNEQKEVKVRAVKVSIDQNKGLFFIDTDDVFDIVNSFYPGGLVGIRLQDVQLLQLEKAIRSNPFINKAEIYTTIKGDVTVRVEQRSPIARVINSTGVSFYIDKNGQKMPSSAKFTARVPVFMGTVAINGGSGQYTADTTLYGSIYKLANYIDSNPFWKAQVQQVNIDEQGEFEIIPMLGNQSILLGKAEQLDEKFKRAMIYYAQVLKNVDAAQYRTVNVKYKNQIICTKYN